MKGRFRESRLIVISVNLAYFRALLPGHRVKPTTGCLCRPILPCVCDKVIFSSNRLLIIRTDKQFSTRTLALCFDSLPISLSLARTTQPRTGTRSQKKKNTDKPKLIPAWLPADSEQRKIVSVRPPRIMRIVLLGWPTRQEEDGEARTRECQRAMTSERSAH